MLLLPAFMNGVVRQDGDTQVPRLTGAGSILYPAGVGQMFMFRDRHLRQLMDRSNSHTLRFLIIFFLNEDA